MFNNLKMGPKIQLSMGVLLLFTLFIGIFGIRDIQAIGTADTKLYKQTTVPIGLMSEMATRFQRIRVNLRDAVLADNSEEIQKYVDRAAELDKELRGFWPEYEKLLITDNGRKAFESFKGAHNRFMELGGRILSLAKAKQDAEAIALMRNAGQQANKDEQDAVDECFKLKLDAAKDVSEGNAKLASEASTTMTVLIVVSLVLGAVFGFLLQRDVRSIIQGLLTETKRLIDAAVNGKLDTRADPEKINFEFRDIPVGVNQVLDAVIGPLNVAAEYVDRISKGDIPPKITDRYNGDFNEIKNNLNQAIDAVNALVADSMLLGKAAVEGKLATRADATKHQGDFRKIVQGVDDCLDAVIGPLNVAAEYVDRISKGDIPPRITDKYNGDFNEIKNNLNQAIDAVNALVADSVLLSKAAVEGKLAIRADATKHQGDFRKILLGVNDTLDALIGPLNMAAGYVDRISKGDIPSKITDNYSGDFNALKTNLNACIDGLQGLVEANQVLQRMAVNDYTCKVEGHYAGVYAEVATATNGARDRIVNAIRITHCVAEGDYEKELKELKTVGKRSEQDSMIPAYIKAMENLNALVEDANALSKAAVEGRLSTRADASRHAGKYRNIIQGFNDTLDAVITPVNEVMRVMAALESGDLTSTIQQNYQGTLQELRNAVNNTVKKLSDTVSEIGQSAGTLASSAEEMTATSATMTAGAEQMTHQANTAAASTEQATVNVKNMAAGIEQISSNSNTVASASEEVSANLNTVGAAVEEMSSNMKVVATTSERMTSSVNSVATAIEEMSVSLNEVSKSSSQAANVASRAAMNAGNAAQIVDKLGLSAQEIGKVVDMIKGIAAQTNLLALNATIEAASAGEAGKGFAVVANEVKELAKQTAAATEDIRAQVEGMQGNTSQVVKAIDEIVQIINQINDISGSIAAAVEEQTATTNEISKNVGEAARGANDVSRNVQQAAAGANEVSRNVQEAAKGVGEIARNINQLATGANDVARNAAEAAKGMNDVAANVVSVNSAAKETTRGANNTNVASRDLAKLAEKLQAAVRKFRL